MASEPPRKEFDDDLKPGFAPALPTDGRSPGEWQSRYSEPGARNAIRVEATYLAIHVFGTLLLCGAVGADLIPFISGRPDGDEAERYIVVWAAGVLGGSLYSVKWLYHSVAKYIWNRDRRLWRFFTPHVSGAMAIVMAALIGSGLAGVLDPTGLATLPRCFGIGFLAGYSSDLAAAKLIELSETLFGTKERHIGRGPGSHPPRPSHHQ